MADWITTTEATQISGFHPDHLRVLVREGRIKGQKWGREWQVSRRSLLVYLRMQESRGERRGRNRKSQT
jgi:hypothetical protein